MRMEEQSFLSYSSSLVAIIEHKLGRSLDPRVREAFLQVPRHLFLQRYYEQKELRNVPPLSDEAAYGAWLTALYDDKALTTQIDARGLPISSSSQPSVMALMLEALSIQPGHSILEIGTGTGYNTALLATLTGDPHLVTSVDIDPLLVDAAHPPIEQIVGPGATICTWNGFDGYKPGAPYDRIIATGSSFPIPYAWIVQLKPGGKLIMDMRGHLSGGIMIITKQSDGTAIAHFLSALRRVSFMRLRPSPEDLASPLFLEGYQQFPLQEKVQLSPGDPASLYALHFSTYEEFYKQDEEVNVWLQWGFPGLGMKWKQSPTSFIAVLTDYLTQTVATIEQKEQGSVVHVWGKRRLWSEIASAYQNWLRAEKPGRDEYTLFIDQHGKQTVSIEQQRAISSFVLTA